MGAARGTSIERVLRRTDRPSLRSCWTWLGYVCHWGYGQVNVNSRDVFTHRVTYEAFRGPVPEGLKLDHLCRNRNCCNPFHLEPVTHAENIRRGKPKWTHCAKGHELTPENSMKKGQGRIVCRICRTAYKREYASRQRAVSA